MTDAAAPPPPSPFGPAPAPGQPTPEQLEVAVWFARTEVLVPNPWYGRASAVLIGAVFAAMVASGVDARAPRVADLVRWGANVTGRTLHGEPWRLLSAAFLHAGFLHVLVNAWGFWQMRWVERTLGRTGFVVVWLVAAVAGNLASLAREGTVVTVGASGALCGLLGASLGSVLAPRRSGVPRPLRRAMVSNMLVLVAVNAWLGATVPAIDNHAHAGGFVAGLLVALATVRPPTPEAARGRARRAALAGLAAAVVLAATFVAVAAAHPREDGGGAPTAASPAHEAAMLVERASARNLDAIRRVQERKPTLEDRRWVATEALEVAERVAALAAEAAQDGAPAAVVERLRVWVTTQRVYVAQAREALEGLDRSR